ncbi:50S ribosomal protein L17 [Candidatus Peregrinibacteria bacterium]|nr:50S ribosomal protein L17 [Candidatus Peregrinibacteria bacterium]
MRHQKKRLKLNRLQGNKTSLFRNLAASVILYEKVQTTKTRAKRVTPLIEKLILIAKKDNSMNAIRKLSAILYDKNASKKLMEKLREKYKDRNSGFTRITAIKNRAGDNASQVQIELI